MRYLSPMAFVVFLTACTPQAAVVPPQATKPEPTPMAPISIQPSVRVFDESLLRGKEYLLEVRSRFVPEVRDPVLGPLGANQTLYLAVERFFLGVVHDNLETATLEPRWAAYLRSWGQKAREAGMGLGTLRLGVALAPSAKETMVRFRWIESKQEQTGWVVVVQEGDSYLISDVQTSGAGPRSGPFDPEAVQEISSPSLR